jgi:hypothetical protein
MPPKGPQPQGAKKKASNVLPHYGEKLKHFRYSSTACHSALHLLGKDPFVEVLLWINDSRDAVPLAGQF